MKLKSTSAVMLALFVLTLPATAADTNSKAAFAPIQGEWSGNDDNHPETSIKLNIKHDGNLDYTLKMPALEFTASTNIVTTNGRYFCSIGFIRRTPLEFKLNDDKKTLKITGAAMLTPKGPENFSATLKKKQ